MDEGPRRSGRRRKQTEFFQVGPPDAKKKTIPTTSDHDATTPDEQQQNIVDPVNYIDRLPREILARIFSLLHFRDRLRVEAVSKLWNKVLKKEGWRYFTQCRLSRQLSARRVQTLFSRCGKNLRELVIGPLTAAEAGLHRHSIGPVVDAISRLPRLHTLSIAHRQVQDAQLQRIGQARLGIRCLHLQNCFDMSQDIYTVMELIQEHFPALRHLSLSSCSLRHPAVTHAYIELPDGLRLLELDDSMGPELAHIFWMSTATRLGVGGGHSRPASFPRLLGCSLDFLRPVNDLTYLPKAEAVLGRLLYFDISFLKEPSPEVLSSLQQAIPLLTNVRIMCLNRIDGNILDAVGEHCGQLEHLEYSSHHLCILDAFPQIAHLRCLRVLGIFHHGQAKQPKNAAPKAVVDTFLRLLVNDPAKLGRPSKLEFLSVNFKLPMDLAVQIVRACPALRFLDYQQPPRDLSPLVSAVDQSREEVIKRRGSNNQQQRQQPLLFFLNNSLWESGHNWARSAWFIPTNEGPEGKMVSVMHEVLARIFEGGPIPELLLRRHTVNYDDE